MVELMVVLAILLVLVTLIMSYIARARVVANQMACANNLVQIHRAFFLYASNYESRFPPPAGTYPKQPSWESFLSPYLNPATAFYCPSDTDMFRLVNSSYDWRDTGNPDTNLAGKLSTSALRQDAVMAYDSLVGWHGRHVQNAVRLDGSAFLMTDDDCAKDLLQSVSPTQGSP